jgi:deoxyribodipyrimidine photolyase
VRSEFWNEMAQATHQAVARELAAKLIEIGVASQSSPGDLLAAPADIGRKEGRGLRVFTPFWRRGRAGYLRDDPCQPGRVRRAAWCVEHVKTDHRPAGARRGVQGRMIAGSVWSEYCNLSPE